MRRTTDSGQATIARALIGGVVAAAVVVLCFGALDARAQTAARVRLPFPKDDGTLTPYTFQLGYALMTLSYDTITWRDANGVPRPWLARSVDTTAAGRQVTIRLRPGVRWQDGRPLTAADVAFTFRFVAQHRHPRFTPQLSDVERVQVRDPRTVVIRLRHPSLGFADQPLADVPILPRHLWSHLRRGQTAPPGLPVGSGPYRLVAHTPGRSYRFVANPNYFLGPPRVKRIEVPIIRTFDRMVAALEQMLVDVVPLSLPGDVTLRLESHEVRIRTGPSYLGTVLMFNLRGPPFDDPAVRRGVADALDVRRIAQTVGQATAADHGYIHPASPWSSSAVVHRANATAARVALSPLGRRRVRILAPDADPVRREAGRQVVSALRRAGVRATLVSLSSDALARAVGESGGKPTFQAAIWSAPPLASDDPDFLRSVFGSVPAAAPLNFSGYSNSGFDALAASVAASPGAAARRRMVAQELRLLDRDAPVVPLLFADGAFASRSTVYDGWVFVKGTGILDKQSFVAEQAPALGRSGAKRASRDRSASTWWPALVLAAAGVAAVGAALLLARRRARQAR